ncbi:hypothetical protein AZ09_05000 [Acetobacter aceti 1023]|nr:hypothetical protein AZ09_05000 [Acetobacter aceti 1023]
MLPFWPVCHNLRNGTHTIAALYTHFVRLKGSIHSPTLIDWQKYAGEFTIRQSDNICIAGPNSCHAALLVITK